MFKNIFKIVTRNLLRQRAYTCINIIGLGIGIAAMVWGYQTYRYSFSFDDFHADRDNVYRAITYKAGSSAMEGIFPAAAVKAAQDEIPGIATAIRYDGEGMNVKSGDKEIFSEHVHFTDPGFFDLFNFALVAGNNNLNDKSAILITVKTAKKYFGNEDPMGKTLLLYAGQPYVLPLTVKGVLKDPPSNSTIQFSFLTNFDNLVKPDGTKVTTDDWKWFLDAAFFKIPNAATAKALPEKLKKYLPLQNKARNDWKVAGFRLLSLRDNASLAGDAIYTNALDRRPSDAATYGPIILGFLLLLSACLNFSNTTVAKANQKLKEIGMRKVMGGTQWQLITQLLFECAFIVLVSIGLAIAINNWWLPVYNKMFVFIDVQANYLHDVHLQLFLLATLIGTTVLAGAYPAFYITKFNPSSIFRGSVKFGGSNIFSRLMLGLQISIAIITVVAGIAFSRNATFQKNFDFGYNMEDKIAVMVKDKNTYDALRNALAGIPQVKKVAGTRYHIGFDYRTRIVEAAGVKNETMYFEIGRQYMQVMDLKMAEGRSFDNGNEGDYTNTVLINEKMAALYGWKNKEALNKQIRIDTAIYSVVGVMKDFYNSDFFEPLEPVAIRLAKEDAYQYLVLQTAKTDLTNVFEKTKTAWQKLFPMQPFRGFYQNEVTAESYQVNSSIAKIFSWFSIVSILLTATGLFALVSLTVLKKTKEIAIRKVSGASPWNILVLISKGYWWIFLLSAFVGTFAGWALSKLLLDLIFKINAGIGSYNLLLAVIAMFIITAITTGIKVWQAVKTNPVKMLRSE